MVTTTISSRSWSAREEVRREEDNELLGFAVPTKAGIIPTTVFGSPLAGPGDDVDAVQVIESLGLAYLGDGWMLEGARGPSR